VGVHRWPAWQRSRGRWQRGAAVHSPANSRITQAFIARLAGRQVRGIAAPAATLSNRWQNIT
jgi:hypothetical protein